LPEGIRTRPKTRMPGDVSLEQQKQTGVPGWQIDLLRAPEMAGYVDTHWLDDVRHLSAAVQAETWAEQRPPVELAYWLRQRRCWRGRAGAEWHHLPVGRIGPESPATGGTHATSGQ
jgi:hypothetical protein